MLHAAHLHNSITSKTTLDDNNHVRYLDASADCNARYVHAECIHGDYFDRSSLISEHSYTSGLAAINGESNIGNTVDQKKAAEFVIERINAKLSSPNGANT